MIVSADNKNDHPKKKTYIYINYRIENEINEINDQIEELENEQDNEPEVYQWFIIDDWGARLLQQETNEIVYYNETLDIYLWGVTHFGTSWNYVLTSIAIDW